MKFGIPQSTGPGAIAASNTTYTSGTITITGVGGGVTVSSNTGQRIDISVAAPVAQTAQTGLSGVAASNTTYTSGTFTITGVGGGVTVSSNTGQRVDISVAAQSVQVVQSALAASNTTYTSGLVVLTGSNMVSVKSSGAGQTVIIDATQSVQVVQSAIAASNTTYTSGLVTITGVGGGITVSSNTGQRIDLSVAAQSVQTQNLVDVTLAGNTSGVLALVSSGTLTLAGGNNITLSQAGNAVTISGPAAAGAQTAISGVAASNTTYTSGTVTFTGVGGGVTVSSNTGQRIDISVAAQSVQTQNAVDVTLAGNTSGVLALVSSGTLTLAGGNNITLSQAGNAVTISGPAAGGAQTAISGVAASNTTYTSGTITITGVGGGVTVSSNTGQRVDISVAAQSVQVVQSAIAASNTTYTSGLVVFTGSNMITVKSSGAGQTVILDATQTNQTANVHNVTISGNTSGALAAISSGTMTLAGGNNITLSQAGNAITISGAAAGGAQTAISGIVASNTTYTSGTVVFSASDGSRSAISIASVGAQSVIVSDAGPTLAYWGRGQPNQNNVFNIAANTQIQFMFPLKPDAGNRFDGLMTANEFRVYVSYNLTATSVSQQLSSTMSLYLYTRTSNSLSMLNSASATFGNTNASTANTSRWNGIRALLIPATSNWSATPTLVYGGEYYIGLRFQTHITTAAFSFLNIAGSGMSGLSGTAGGNSFTNPIWRPGYGNYTNLGSVAVNLSDIGQGANATHDPYVLIVNSTGITW